MRIRSLLTLSTQSRAEEERRRSARLHAYQQAERRLDEVLGFLREEERQIQPRVPDPRPSWWQRLRQTVGWWGRHIVWWRAQKRTG